MFITLKKNLGIAKREKGGGRKQHERREREGENASINCIRKCPEKAEIKEAYDFRGHNVNREGKDRKSSVREKEANVFFYDRKGLSSDGKSTSPSTRAELKNITMRERTAGRFLEREPRRKRTGFLSGKGKGGISKEEKKSEHYRDRRASVFTTRY